MKGIGGGVVPDFTSALSEARGSLSEAMEGEVSTSTGFISGGGDPAGRRLLPSSFSLRLTLLSCS